MSRPVFAVLEIHGEGWLKWQAEQETTQRAIQPNMRVTAFLTRLIVVDAGRDPGEMMRRYPDRAKYLIVHGVLEVVPFVTAEERRWSGSITELLPNSIHVPLPVSETLRPFTEFRKQADVPRYAVTICFGRRYEPWIESVRLL